MQEIFTKKLNGIFTALTQGTLPKKLVVAVSGGSDSLALTILLHNFCQENNIELFAVTVNHKMRHNSTEEAQELEKILRKFSINHQILNSNLTQKPKANIEAELRQMRFFLLHQFCQEQGAEHLFLGHHLGDLAENFLIRLFRGSGIDGLSPISEISEYKQIKLIRPLLDFQKEDLQNYLTKHQISWLEDQSNNEEKFLRNKIRSFLKTLPDNHLIATRINGASRHIKESKEIIDQLVLEGAKQVLEFNNLGYFLLKRDSFFLLNQQIALKILAYVLMEIGGNPYKPRLEKLKSFYNSIKVGNLSKATSFYGCIIEKYDTNKLIIYRERSAINLTNPKFFNQKEVIIDNRFLIAQSSCENLYLLDSKALNLLAKEHLELRKLKNPLKKVFYTIPIRNTEDILTNKLKFYFKTILKTAFNENL